MSALIERISSRYHEDRIRIEVPEWGEDGAPLVAYSRLFTVHDERRVVRAASGDADDPETWARVVFFKLEDEAGEPLFAGGDFARFKRTASAAVIKRIGAQIFAATPSIEDAVGNSPGTPD